MRRDLSPRPPSAALGPRSPPPAARGLPRAFRSSSKFSLLRIFQVPAKLGMLAAAAAGTAAGRWRAHSELHSRDCALCPARAPSRRESAPHPARSSPAPGPASLAPARREPSPCAPTARSPSGLQGADQAPALLQLGVGVLLSPPRPPFLKWMVGEG